EAEGCYRGAGVGRKGRIIESGILSVCRHQRESAARAWTHERGRCGFERGTGRKAPVPEGEAGTEGVSQTRQSIRLMLLESISDQIDLTIFAMRDAPSEQQVCTHTKLMTTDTTIFTQSPF